MSMTGKCLCGAVRFIGKGAHTGIHVCHCSDCARWTGGPFMAIGFEDAIAVEGPVRWFQSSQWAERGSCATCGSALFWRLQDGSMMNVGVGNLDDRATLTAIDEHIYVDQKPPFYDFSDTAPRLTGAELLARFEASQ